MDRLHVSSRGCASTAGRPVAGARIGIAALAAGLLALAGCAVPAQPARAPVSAGARLVQASIQPHDESGGTALVCRYGHADVPGSMVSVRFPLHGLPAGRTGATPTCPSSSLAAVEALSALQGPPPRAE